MATSPVTALGKARNELAQCFVGVTSGDDGPTYTIATARVKFGWISKDPTDDSFAKDIIDNGPLILIGFPIIEITKQGGKVGFGSIPMEMYIYKSKSADWAGHEETDLVANVMAAALNDSNFSNAGGPESFGPAEWNYEYHKSKGILRVSFSCQIFDPPKEIRGKGSKAKKKFLKKVKF